MSSFPIKEFHMCMMGASNVGKTSLCERLHGKVFTRKPSKPSLEEEASKYSIEVKTSLGLLLFHLYDWAWEVKRWAWEVKRREDSRAVNPQLMRGADGALFVYDVTDKGTLRCFGEFNDWYQRASGLLLLLLHLLLRLCIEFLSQTPQSSILRLGFDKPWLIIANKNDTKKKVVQDSEGQAVVKAGDRRQFAAISLVDDTGIDDLGRYLF